MAGIAVLDNMQRGLTALPGVKGIITVQNSTGLPVRTTVSSNLAAVIAHHVLKIIPKAKAVLTEVDPTDSIAFVRIRGKNFEYLVVLEKEYSMISIQEHTEFKVESADAAQANSGAMRMTVANDTNANRTENNDTANSDNANLNANNDANYAIGRNHAKDKIPSFNEAEVTINVSANANPRLLQAAAQRRRRSRRSRSAAGNGNAAAVEGRGVSVAKRRTRGGSARPNSENKSELDFMRVSFLPRQ